MARIANTPQNDKVRAEAKRRAAKVPNPLRALASPNIAGDVLNVRRAGKISQQSLAEVFGWSKAAISKIENGRNDVYLSDYLKIVNLMRAAVPGHPAIALHDYLFGRRVTATLGGAE
jgi:DNA-binding XRE family transcriptional regulator